MATGPSRRAVAASAAAAFASQRHYQASSIVPAQNGLHSVSSLISICAVEITSAEPPEWIELIPAGRFSAVDGRGTFENSDPDSIIAASIAKMPQAGLVVDYNHSTDLAAPEGRPSPAAGWIKEFKVENGAIFARVEWTQEAAEALSEKKYRYISPVFNHDDDGRVTCILRAGVTNNPALADLAAIASAQLPIPMPLSLAGSGERDLRVETTANYAYTDSGGKRHLPIGDADHARNALVRFGQTYFESEVKAKTAWSHIMGACRKFGIDIADDTMPHHKIKEPSSGYKKASAVSSLRLAGKGLVGVALEPPSHGGVSMAKKETMAEGEERSLSEVVAGLEELFPQMTQKQILQMAIGAIDGDWNDDDAGASASD